MIAASHAPPRDSNAQLQGVYLWWSHMSCWMLAGGIVLTE